MRGKCENLQSVRRITVDDGHDDEFARVHAQPPNPKTQTCKTCPIPLSLLLIPETRNRGHQMRGRMSDILDARSGRRLGRLMSVSVQRQQCASDARESGTVTYVALFVRRIGRKARRHAQHTV